jgi:hypothetical protein
MEKYKNFDDAILSLQNEVNRYSFGDKQTTKNISDSNEINIISSIPLQKIDFNKMMLIVPFLLFFLFLYFRPKFILIDNPHDKRGLRVNYGKLIITIFLISGGLYCIKYSYTV